MRKARIIANIHAGGGQPLGQLPQVDKAHGFRQLFVGAGREAHGHFELQGTEVFERPVLARAAGEGMDGRKVLRLDSQFDADRKSVV